MALIGISLAWLGPRLGGSLQGVNTRTAAREIAAVLRYGRMQAVEANQAVATWFDGERKQVRAELIDAPKSSPTAVEKEDEDPESNPVSALAVYTTEHALSIVNTAEDAEDQREDRFVVLFFADGSSSGGQIEIHDPKDRIYRVNIDAMTGVVSVKEGQPS